MDDYKVSYLPQFSIEFENYPEYQQDSVLDFTDKFEEVGLSDFSNYEGKITPSWKGLGTDDPKYTFTKDNHMWHYHIGLPEYKQKHGKYKTSTVVLHFQWPDKGTEISLVDLYDHYTSEGVFYLPPEHYLDR